MKLAADRGFSLAAVFLAGGQPASAPSARVADAFGKVEKKLPGGSAYQLLSVGDRLPVAATIRTGENGAALIELPDKHVVRVGAQTTVVLSQLGQDKQFALKVLAGQVWTLVKKANHPAKFTVETSSGVAGVTGTFFGVAVDEETSETVVSTGEGSVAVQTLDEQGQPSGDAVAVTQGMMTRVARRRVVSGAIQQSREHRQMWQLLHREGAWTQQNGQGGLRLSRGNELNLYRLLRAKPHGQSSHSLPAAHPPHIKERGATLNRKPRGHRPPKLH